MNKRSMSAVLVLALAALGVPGCAEKSDQSSAPTQGEKARDEGQNAKSNQQPTAIATAYSSASPNFRSPGTGAPQTIGRPEATTETAPVPARRGKRATVKAASAQAASGRLTLTEVETAIDESFDQFSKCSSGDDATVSLRAVVAPSGKVIEVSSTRSTPDDPRMRDCVVTAFRALQFPAVNGAAPAPLSFELVVADS